MILVDTSVFIEHLRGRPRAARLVRLLDAEEVLLHPMVLGEIAIGSLGRRRREVLALLRLLPVAQVVDETDGHALVEARGLAGRGIGWIDAHLLCAALVGRVPLWTFDRALRAVAAELSAGYTSGGD